MFKKLFDNSGISEEIGKAICEYLEPEKGITNKLNKNKSELEKTLSQHGLDIIKIDDETLKCFSNICFADTENVRGTVKKLY